MYKFSERNSSLCFNQSGFRKSESSISKLLSIVHHIYSSKWLSIWSKTIPCLDMSKASDQVWDKGLMYKFKSVGISDNLKKRLKLFLDNRYEVES